MSVTPTRGWDDFNRDLRFLLDGLIEEYISALRIGQYILPETLLAQVDDIDAKAWLLEELRATHVDWAVERAKAQVAARFDDHPVSEPKDDLGQEYDSNDDFDSGSSPTSPLFGWPDGFELIKTLKPGGTARVYLARERAVGRQVILKVPRQATKHAKPPIEQVSKIHKRFLREGRTLGRLAADGVRAVPQFHQFVFVGESKWPILVMEYVQGKSLSKVLKARKAGFDKFLYENLESFARDLHDIHIIRHNHLDLKPLNIHVRRDGSWTALDWGFGRNAEEEVPTDTTSPNGSPCPRPPDDDLGSTARYKAPEQALGGAGWKERKSDVFALGAIQHRILTGLELLPDGLDEDELEDRTLKGQFDDARARLLAMADGDPMARLALECLNTNPDDRPDAGPVADRIRAHLEALKLEDQERQNRKAKAMARRTLAITVVGILSGSLAIVSALAFLAESRRRDAVAAEGVALEAKTVAETRTREAEQARLVAETKTREAQRSEFLREVEASDVAMGAGLFDKARKFFSQARRRPGTTDADRTDLDLNDLRAAMFLNDLKVVDRHLVVFSGRTDLSPKQRARLDLEMAIREMHLSMEEPGALTSSREGPRDKHILELLERAEPNLDEADRLTARGLQATTIDSALVAYQAALNLEPRHPYASSYVLQTYLLAGRAEDGLTQANAWGAATPGDPLPWFYQAVLLTSIGRHAEAEEAMGRLRAADGAGRVIGPSTIAQCESMVRVVAAIDDGLNNAAFGGRASTFPFLKKILAVAAVPGGRADVSLFSAPLPPAQRRVFGGFFSGMAVTFGFGPLLKGNTGIMALFAGPSHNDALADLSDPSGFIAPGQALYFQVLLIAAGLSGDGAKDMARLASIVQKLDQAAEGATFWDIRGLCMFLSAGFDLRRSDWSRAQASIAAKRGDLSGWIQATSLAVDVVYLRDKAGTTLIRAAALPRAGREYRDQLLRVAKRHGDPGVIKAVSLLNARWAR